MRKVASINKAGTTMKRAMTFASDEGVYLFLYDSVDDGPSTADHLFDTFEAAEEEAADTYGIRPDAWQIIPDPLPGCQHDWISPTRVKQDPSGKKLWGQFEPAG